MDAITNKKSNPITGKQKELLVEFISARKEMYTGNFTPSYTKEKMKQYWIQLTNILNAVPDGPCKEWKQWRKTWVDIKKNSKAKFVRQKHYTRGTGGGPPMPPVPPEEVDIDDRILDMITPVGIYGNENVLESDVCFQLDPISGIGSEATCHDEKQLTVQWDHTYIEPSSPDNSVPNTEIAMDTTERTANLQTEKLTTPKVTPLSKRKITKTTRLTKSLGQTEKLLHISQNNLEMDREYKRKKLEIMERDSIEKKEYHVKKVQLLQDIANYVKEIKDQTG